MGFYTESEPPRGAATQVAPDVFRFVANNPSNMTFWGTNSYGVKTKAGTYVIDPGPSEDDVHLEAVLKFLETDGVGIIVTHHHSDHFGAVPKLKALSGLPVIASERFADDTFRPDIMLKDGDQIGGLTTIYTPGHASDHLCFSRDDGLVFTGDHIMTWSSSIVMLPDGDMGEYCQQLRRFLERDDKLYLPGHGPPLDNPGPYVRQLLDHRERRDAEIFERISKSPATSGELSAELYSKVGPGLSWAVERNVEAHLDKMRREGVAVQSGQAWRAV